MKKEFDEKYFNEFSEKQEDKFNTYKKFIEKNRIGLNKKRIGDFGCARGLFLKELINNNTCYGYDISKFIIQQCKKNYPKIENNFRVLDLNKKIDINNKFDVICLFDVIEHLTNFSNIIKFIEKNLEKEGILIITTPNANSLLRIIVGKNNYTGEQDKTHTMLFTPYTLDFFLRRCGLRKITLSTPYSFYFKDNLITRKILFGGQIFAIYKK